MNFRAYVPIVPLLLLGLYGSPQQAHAEPPPILWYDLVRVIDGIEMNYQSPFLWIRYSITASATDTAKMRYCYKMDVRQSPNRTNGWVSAYNYSLNGWTQAYTPMTAADTAWCWQ